MENKLNKNEDNTFYLTDTLVVKNNKIYVKKEINEKDKFYKINKNNWHKYLVEYGWQKLDHFWKDKIKFNHNFPFGFLDCGGGGDCLFLVIAEALNLTDIYNGNEGNKFNVDSIRNVAANEVKQDNFTNILEIYRALFDNDDFDGDWNPYKVNNIEEFKKIIKTKGDQYWGDHLILDLLQKGLNINFILMKTDIELEDDDDLNYFYPIGRDIDENSKYIIIYYTDEIHFQLVGYFDGNVMKVIFNYDELPKKLIKMYKRDMNKT